MTTTEAPIKYEYDRIAYLVAYQNIQVEYWKQLFFKYNK